MVKKDTTVHQKKTPPAASTQLYLSVAEIKDNTVVLKNGGIRAVLQTSSVNFNLKSEQEQNSIIYAYQSFLNTLEFPIQIVVRSKKLDIDKYLDNLKILGDKQTNILLQRQTQEYIEYIKKLVEYADIMEKSFYVIVPYEHIGIQKQNMFQKFWDFIHPKDTVENIKRRHREFAELQKGLKERVNIVKSGLINCNLRVKQLSTPELIELFYRIYNPITARNEKLHNIDATNIVQG